LFGDGDAVAGSIKDAPEGSPGPFSDAPITGTATKQGSRPQEMRRDFDVAGAAPSYG